MQRLYSQKEATPLGTGRAGGPTQAIRQEPHGWGTYAALTQKLLEHIDRLSRS